nr:reverse transcriptase domain-containing protein [Tanacetum cinerariifolium]
MIVQPLLAKPRTYMLWEPIKVNFQNQNRNQGNNHGIPQGNNQGRNQFFQKASHGPNPPPAYQAPSYQGPVHQASIPQPQVVTTTDFTNYMKENNAILKNMQTNMTSLINSNLELKNMFGQFIKMNTASSSGSGTLPSNTVTNPKEDLKGITTRSGTTYKGPTVPTTSSSLPQVVERKTEVTKDTVPPTNNGSTKDVQPLVVQIETLIPNSELVVAPVAEPVVASVSALKPNWKPSIPYPSRLHDQKLRDKTNDQKEKFFQIFQDLNFNISFADALILMPEFGPIIKSLLSNKDKLFELARTPLNEHCSAVLLKKLPEKLRDPDKFLIPSKNDKYSIDKLPEVELKDLPPHLEYVFLEGDDKLPVIIVKDLSFEEKAALIKVLKSHKRAIAWKLSDIKGIDLKFCTHKILMEDNFKPAVEHQRRVNPKIHKVINKEVLKLLDVRLIYPISDSPWVSPVHCVPKKGDFTVVENEGNELIPTRLVTGWNVCIDYRKLIEATRKDHFPLPFMDQMLERLARHEYYCFLDGFLGYFQILIDPKDQEKTTFTDQFAKVILKYGVTHRLATAYYPQTSRQLPVCYDDDDDEEESNSLKDNIISELPLCSAITPNEPIDSLSMGDEHLDAIPKTESDELINSCVVNLVPNPRIDKSDCHPENEIRLSQKLLYDNSSPRPSKEFNSENSYADIESFSPSPIPNEDSDSFMEEINLFLTADDPMPPSIEDDDESEGDILFLERLLHDDPIPLSDTLNFSYEVRIFLPFFTYPETKDSLIMGDEHLDTIPEKDKLYEFIKSSVKNLVPNPSESEDEREYDVPVCDDFTTFSNFLFDAADDFSSSDDKLFFDEDVSNEIYLNPLFDEEIISIKTDPHHFNAEYDLIESLLNQYSLIISSSKIDSVLDEFVGELIFLKLIPSGIDEADCDPEEEICLIEKLLYDNSSPRPLKESNSENSDAVIKSFSPSPIPFEDSNPFMEEIDLFLTSDGSITSGINSDYSDSEGDNLFPERLLHDDPIPISDILDSSNVVIIFPPFFTYPVTSSILLSSCSEDIIFDPCIFDYHFPSFKPCISHRSGTFMKFNVYSNNLNESPMEILSSTCFLMD